MRVVNREKIMYNIRGNTEEGNDSVIRYICTVFFCAVLMILALPVKCTAADSRSSETSDRKTVSAEESREGKSSEDKNDGDWKIFLSIGAGITIVAVVIGAIASRDAK